MLPTIGDRKPLYNCATSHSIRSRRMSSSSTENVVAVGCPGRTTLSYSGGTCKRSVTFKALPSPFLIMQGSGPVSPCTQWAARIPFFPARPAWTATRKRTICIGGSVTRCAAVGSNEFWGDMSARDDPSGGHTSVRSRSSQKCPCCCFIRFFKKSVQH